MVIPLLANQDLTPMVFGTRKHSVKLHFFVMNAASRSSILIRSLHRALEETWYTEIILIIWIS